MTQDWANAHVLYIVSSYLILASTLCNSFNVWDIAHPQNDPVLRNKYPSTIYHGENMKVVTYTKN